MKISKNSEGIGWKKENNVSIDGENIDLTSYAKKSDLPTKTSQLTNDSGFLTSVPNEYQTRTDEDLNTDSKNIVEAINELQNKLQNEDNNNIEKISNFELGAFSQGNPTNSNQRIRNIDFIKVNKGDIVKFSNFNELYRYTIIMYDSNKSYISKDYGWLTNSEFVIEYDGYLKCMIAYMDNSKIEDILTVSTDRLSIQHLSTEELVEGVKTSINYMQNGGNSYNWFVPKDLYIIQERNGKRRLEIGNIINAHNIDDFYLTNDLTHMYNHDDKYILIEDTGSVIRNQNVVINRKTFDTFLAKSVISLKCVASSHVTNPSSNKNVLIIGDSFIDQGYLPCEVKNILVNDLGLTNLNFVGKKSDTDGDITCSNEGNGGITLLDYVKTDNTQGRGTQWSNPFLFDGTISYQTYMTNNSFGNLDICVIMCGVNDILTYSSTESDLVGRLKQMVDKIHSEYPECKIFIVGQKYASDETDYIDCFKWNEKIIKMNSSYQDFCYNNSYKAFCFYVDCGLLFNRLYGSTYEKTPIYKGSDELRIKVTDWLHPNKMGYYQIAENIASAIAYNCFKN